MQITERIHRLSMLYRLNENILPEKNVNIYLLLGKRIVLIDTGIYGSEKIIFDYIENIGRSIEEISHILLTHAHPENAGSVMAIREKTQCKIGMHAFEESFIQDDKKTINYPFINWEKYEYQKFEPDFYLNDGEILEIDEKLRIKVIFTPGHTRGSVCFLFQQDNALFTGDTIPSFQSYPIFASWKKNLHSLEKIENLPYPKFILPGRDDFYMNENTQDFISNGIERMYQVYTIYNNLVSTNKEEDLIAEYIWRSLGLPVQEYHDSYEKILIKSFSEIKI